MTRHTTRGLRLAGLGLSSLLAACGARTGLLVPDVELPADVTALDAADVPDATDVLDAPVCAPGRFVLVARAADLLLVIDRSSSMGQGLGAAGASKWALLRGALAATLPRFQDRINVGALFYPESGAESREASCALANIPDVDIAPAVG